MYQVEHGGVVPQIGPVRVAELVEQRDAARQLITEIELSHEIDHIGPDLLVRIRAFLKGGAA